MKSLLARMLQSLVFILVSTWLLLAILLYVFQPGFIYFPHTNLQATPQNAGLEYKDVYLMTGDKTKIHGWYMRHETPRATLLFLHGNGGNISHRLDKLFMFHQMGLSVFIIDYRGYGQSTGKPGEQGTYHDAEAAWNYLSDEIKVSPDKIIVYGESLGGGVASWLVAKHQPGALILESTFTSIADMGRVHYPYLPVNLLARIRYPTLERISQITCPLLIIHSPQDEIVPYTMGKRIYDAANQPKDFLEIKGDHNNGFMESGEIYIDGLYRFLLTHFPDEAA